MHRLQRARRDAGRQFLVEVAERVFSTRGYEGTRMQDIAAEADLAIATVYKLFDSKDALYAEVHRARGGAMLEHAMQATAGAGSAWEALLAGVAAYAEYLVAHPAYLTLHLQESQPWALHPRFKTREQTRLWQDGLQLTVEVFRAAIAEGSVTDEDPLLYARLMIASHQVFLGEWVEKGMKEPSKDLVARMQAHAERAFSARGHHRRSKSA